MKIHAILFDCDGTLVDSEPIMNAVLSEVLARNGVAMSPEECVRTFIGTNIAYVTRWVAEHKGVMLGPEFMEEIKPLVRRHCRESLREIPGAKALLASLTLPRAVVSNSGHEYLRLVLGLTGLLEHVEPHIFSGHDVPNPKPAPDVYLHAAAAMHLDPARCLVVEDTVAGVTAAKGAGMRVAALASGPHATAQYRANLRAAGADELIDQLAAVGSLV
ncbi:MAG: HAD family hydrolase [Phycisphaerales bacterium]